MAGAGVLTVGFLLWWFSVPNAEVEKRKEQAAAAQWVNSQTRTPNTGTGDPPPQAAVLTPTVEPTQGFDEAGKKSSARTVTAEDIRQTVDPRVLAKDPIAEKEYWRNEAIKARKKLEAASSGQGSGMYGGNPYEDPNSPLGSSSGTAKDRTAAIFEKDVQTYVKDQAHANGGGSKENDLSTLRSKFSNGDGSAGYADGGSYGSAGSGSYGTHGKETARSGEPSATPAAGPPAPANPEAKTNPLAVKSMVYLREEKKAPVGSAHAASRGDDSLSQDLELGTKLKARLLSKVTTAVNLPVITVIEYNYSMDEGVVLIPAGSKAYGRIDQAHRNGEVRMVFTSIRTPDNNEIPINGVAVALNGSGAVQGHVSGKNAGKRFFARTVSGVAAAAALGLGRSGGFSSPLTYGDLARERVATNIVNQGEQAINNLNQGENIVVSVPANTRFEIFLVSTVKITSAIN